MKSESFDTKNELKDLYRHHLPGVIEKEFEQGIVDRALKENKKSKLKELIPPIFVVARMTWVFSLIIPFVLLEWKWAIITLLINFIGILPLGILVIGILKPVFGAGHWILSFFTGISEALFYVLLASYLNPPDKFLLALVIVYLINQTGRMFRSGNLGKDEAITLLGFISFLIINFVI